MFPSVWLCCSRRPPDQVYTSRFVLQSIFPLISPLILHGILPFFSFLCYHSSKIYFPVETVHPFRWKKMRKANRDNNLGNFPPNCPIFWWGGPGTYVFRRTGTRHTYRIRTTETRENLAKNHVRLSEYGRRMDEAQISAEKTQPKICVTTHHPAVHGEN